MASELIQPLPSGENDLADFLIARELDQEPLALFRPEQQQRMNHREYQTQHNAGMVKGQVFIGVHRRIHVREFLGKRDWLRKSNRRCLPQGG